MKIRKLTKKEVSTLVAATGTLVAAAGTGMLIGMVIRQLKTNVNTDYFSDKKLDNILADLVNKQRLAVYIDASAPIDQRESIMNSLSEVKILTRLIPKHKGA
jgi:hypothetical protein